jgi:PAS domain S-box-containing protein
VVGTDGTILLANSRVEEQFGYQRDELVGKPVDILVPEALRGAHASHRQNFKTMAEARPMGTRQGLRGRRRNGTEFPVDISLNPVDTSDGMCVLAIVNAAKSGSEVDESPSDAIEGHVEFEALVAELNFKFNNLLPDQVIDTVYDALRKTGEMLGVDRCSFFRFRGADVPLVPLGVWQRTGVAPSPMVTAPRERVPWVIDTLLDGKMICFSSVDEVPNPTDRATYQSYGVKSAVTMPLSTLDRVVGAIGFNMTTRERTWTPGALHRIRVVASVFSNILARFEGDEALRDTIAKIERRRDQLQAENLYLRREVRERHGTGVILGESRAIIRVLDQARQVAATDSTVLLLGETGTGKELIATEIHELSARRGRVMVRVNCSAIPGTLMESELFGREKGAFTGALARQIGRFELADHSTIFLDEIGDLPAEVQVKLLRVIEERQIERLGSPKPIRVDVRIIAATHRNLEKRITEEIFREDLFYRLNVFPIQVPPLRDRIEDIPLLVWRFVEEFSKAFGKRITAIPREDMAALQRYAWPGNIRELRNVVERAMIVATGSQLNIVLPALPVPSAKRSLKLADVETDHIRSVLESTGWKIRGATGAAARLGLKPTTLETRMAKLGLVRPRQS